jgi:hypothetical protein
VGEGQIWGENNGGVGEDGERFGLIQRGEDNQNSQNRLFLAERRGRTGVFAETRFRYCGIILQGRFGCEVLLVCKLLTV